jgi:hypothetical protein
MSGRTTAEYECQACGTKFHPLYGSKKLYCSPQCAGRGVGIKREAAAQARSAARLARIPIEDDLAWLESLQDSDPDWDLDDDQELFS